MRVCLGLAVAVAVMVLLHDHTGLGDVDVAGKIASVVSAPVDAATRSFVEAQCEAELLSTGEELCSTTIATPAELTALAAAARDAALRTAG